VAAGLYAVFLPGVELVIRPHRDIWVTFVYIASVAMLFKMEDLSSLRRRLVGAAALGVSLAMVAWMRSTVVAYVLVCAGAMFFVLPRRHAVAAAGVLLISFAAVLSPLVVRNYNAFGTLMVTRGAVWHSFWGGIGQFENSMGVVEDDAQIARVFGARDSTAIYGTPRYEQVLRRYAKELIAAEPLWYAATVVKRAIVIVAPKIGRELFFRSPSRSNQTGLLNQNVSRTVLMIVDGLFVAGLLAGVWLLRRRWKVVLVAVLPLAYTIATLAPFYVVGRNIMNVYFVTLLFASVAFVHVVDRTRTSRTSVSHRSTETKGPLPMS
jgi:hypothetical protein